MRYLVGWTASADRKKIRKLHLDIIEARSHYQAASRFIRKHYSGSWRTIDALRPFVTAKCLDDDRFAIPVDTSRPIEEIARSLGYEVTDDDKGEIV